MSNARLRLRMSGDLHSCDQLQQRPGSALGELFAPFDRLLTGGGDGRLALDPVSGINPYGCQPLPCAGRIDFSSSTATSISQRAYEAAGRSRGALMQSAIEHGLDDAFDMRIEQMRDELKAHLEIEHSSADVIFSASGTDAQLQALYLTRALLGAPITTIVVAADQTGSGTAHTARGQHFGDVTANGVRVGKGMPIEGLAESTAIVTLPLRDDAGELRAQAENDATVLGAVERAITRRRNVLLQVMDSSKLGWRVPSDSCAREISTRWPGQVQIVVDACQMRLSRQRLRAYLDRGYFVLLTGSKYFTGPPFSGALLVPAAISGAIATLDDDAPGICEYGTRYDWPKRWTALRARFPGRPNFGQWLRWEAALEEIRGYYAVPAAFRHAAILDLGNGIADAIASSPSLRRLPPQPVTAGNGLDDDELTLPTIFAFTIERHGRALPLDGCKAIHRALAPTGLIGQPVEWRGHDGQSIAALRICIGARHVTESWAADPETSCRNLKHLRDASAAIAATIERLLQHHDQPKIPEMSHGN